MNIGLDIHGVVDRYPKFFAEMTRLFVDEGHKVHVITGATLRLDHPKGVEILKFIGEVLGLSFTHHFSIVDYQEEIGTEIEYLDDSDNPWMDGEMWDRTKGDYCKKHGIDIMLDDTQRYSKYFVTPFVQFMPIKPEK